MRPSEENGPFCACALEEMTHWVVLQWLADLRERSEEIATLNLIPSSGAFTTVSRKILLLWIELGAII